MVTFDFILDSSDNAEEQWLEDNLNIGGKAWTAFVHNWETIAPVGSCIFPGVSLFLGCLGPEL